jgi:hypothetical protein
MWRTDTFRACAHAHIPFSCLVVELAETTHRGRWAAARTFHFGHEIDEKGSSQ